MGRGSAIVEWTFGTLLWASLVLFFRTAVVWMFIAVFADILRRNMSGWAKAARIIVIVVLPFLGTLVYVIVRPTAERQAGADEGGASDEIAKAARSQAEGRISEDEFVHLKQRALRW
jgi:uncharacterized membrane protein